MREGRLPVPAYLPEDAGPVLGWTKRHVAIVAARYGANLDDLWDEAVTALIRASIHFRPEPPAGKGGGRDGSPYDPVKAFSAYAKLAVHRACWRYCIRGIRGKPALLSLEGAAALTVPLPSPEEWLIAAETVRDGGNRIPTTRRRTA